MMTKKNMMMTIMIPKVSKIVWLMLISIVAAAPDYYEDLYEGNFCPMEDGSTGICKELPSCPSRVREVLAGKRFALSMGHCSFKGNIEIVCCENPTTTTMTIPATNIPTFPPTTPSKTTATTKTTKTTTRTTTEATTFTTNRSTKAFIPNSDSTSTKSFTGEVVGYSSNNIDGSNLVSKLKRRPADVACFEYERGISGDDSGTGINPNIFNGARAATGEFPYMVALGYLSDPYDPTMIKYSCGGSLISARHVLTAAHCVNNINNYVPTQVRLGTIDLNDEGEHVQQIQVSEVISHPKYKRSMNYYDIAVLLLKKPATFSSFVMPICLQTKPIPNIQQLVNLSLIVTGWGATSFVDDFSTVLQKTPSLQIVETKACSEFYKGFSKLPRGLDNSMLCVLDGNVTARSDACQGDSGGPLLLRSQVSSTVLGVTSFGQSCGSSVPAVYTSVLFYLDWIESVVWPNSQARRAS